MSEFPHYQQPSSLPSSYALMSHFNPELDPDEREAEEGSGENGAALEESSEGIPIQQNIDPALAGPYGPVSFAIKRRRTMSSVNATRRPSRPTMSPVPGTPVEPPEEVFVDERAPLLGGAGRRESEQKTELPKTGWSHFGVELNVLCRYSFPILATQVLEYSLVVASVISIGHIGTEALAGSTLGNMTGSVTGYSISLGFVCALDTLLPSAWTSDDPRMVGLWTQRMVVLMTILLVPMFTIWFNTESILLLLHQEPEVARYAGLYLKYASIGLPAYTYNAIAKRYFQSQGLMHVPTVATVIVAPLNLFLNWLLVWGPEPVRLGFKGAPLATAFSFNLMLVVFVIYGAFFAPKTAWLPVSRRSFTRLGELVSLGVAGVGMTVSEWWSWEVVALAASLLGPAALAAQSVILSTCSGLWQASNALSIAAAVRVGNLLGAGQPQEASLACKVSLFMGLCAASLMGGLLVTFRHNWAYMFNNDPSVVRLVSQILPLCAGFQAFDALATVSSGVLRGLGKQSHGAVINLTAYYVIGIPLGLWLTFHQHLQLFGIWIGLTSALVYASLVSVILVLRADWNHEVQKALARFQADQAHQAAMDEAARVAHNGSV